MFFYFFYLYSLLLFPNFPPSTIDSKNSSEHQTFFLSPRSTLPSSFLFSCLGVVFARPSTEAAPYRRIIPIPVDKIEAKQEIKLDADAADAADATDATAADDAAGAEAVEETCREEEREEEEREAEEEEEEERPPTPGKLRLFSRQNNENNNRYINEHIIRGRGSKNTGKGR